MPVHLEMRVSLALAAAISNHPAALAFVEFNHVKTISGFSAIVAAIQQNKNLKTLVLVGCGLSSSDMTALEWLLEANGLANFETHNCSPANGVCIARGLCSNQSLKRLSIEGLEDDDEEEFTVSLSSETIKAIPYMLSTNKHIQALRIAETTIQPNVILQIVDAVASHESLTSLTLSSTGATREVATNVFPRLVSNAGLKVLKLSSNRLGDAGAVALASRLRINTTIESLDLHSNGIGSEGATALADSLSHNAVLKEMNLGYNSIGDDGAVSLAQALTRNETLTTLKVLGFGERGLNAFASCLPSARGIQALEFSCCVKNLTRECVSRFLEALERNTELVRFTIWKNHDGSSTDELIDEIEPKVELQMALNRAGKRILKSESHVPDSLWPLILAKFSNKPDVLYFFLREKPDVLKNRPPPPTSVRESRNKRKRD